MADNKKKWTVIDTVIVLVVAVACAFAYNMFSTKSGGGEKNTIEAVVLMSNSEPALAEAITVGEPVTISLTEKDSGILKDLRTEPAQTMSYNAVDGEYINTSIEGRVDIYATVEMKVSETDYAFIAGSTKIKVGTKLPFRGKGYATEGYIIDITEGGQN